MITPHALRGEEGEEPKRMTKALKVVNGRSRSKGRIFEVLAAYIEKFLAVINKEADSWSTWQSVEPLPDSEAEYVLTHLRRRALPATARYRDKSRGQVEVKAKCRVVALGHVECRPTDLKQLSRNSGTQVELCFGLQAPTRSSLMN